MVLKFGLAHQVPLRHGQIFSSPKQSSAGSHACVKPGAQSLERKAGSGIGNDISRQSASPEGKSGCLESMGNKEGWEKGKEGFTGGS